MAGEERTYDLKIRIGTEGIKSVELADTKLDKVGRTADRTGRKFGQANRRLHRTPMFLRAIAAAMAILLAVTAPLTAASATFARGQAQVATMLNEQALGADKAAQHLKEYAAGVRRISVEVGESTATLNKGLYDILSAGVAPAKALDVLTISAKAAKAGVTDTGTAADFITSALKAYGLAADEAGRVSDIAFATVAEGKLTFQELAASIGQVAPTSAQVGVSLAQLGAMMATVTKQGIKAAEASAAINQFMISFMRSQPKARKAWHELAKGTKLAGTEWSTALIQGENLVDLLDILANATDEQKVALFAEVNALRAANALVKQREGYLSSLKRTTDSAGETQRAYNKINGDLQTQLDRVGQVGQDVAVTFGQALEPSVRRITDGILSWYSANREVIDQNIAGVADTIAASIGLAADGVMWLSDNADIAAVALGTLAVAIVGLRLGAFIANLQAAGGALQVLGGIIKGHPIIAIVAILGTVTAGFMALSRASKITANDLREAAAAAKQAYTALEDARAGVAKAEKALATYDRAVVAAAGDETKLKKAVDELIGVLPQLGNHYQSVQAAMQGVNAARGVMLQQKRAEIALQRQQAEAKQAEHMQKLATAIADATDRYKRLQSYLADPWKWGGPARTMLRRVIEDTDTLIEAFVQLNGMTVDPRFGPQFKQQAATARDSAYQLLTAIKGLAETPPAVLHVQLRGADTVIGRIKEILSIFALSTKGGTTGGGIPVGAFGKDVLPVVPPAIKVAADANDAARKREADAQRRWLEEQWRTEADVQEMMQALNAQGMSEKQRRLYELEQRYEKHYTKLDDWVLQDYDRLDKYEGLKAQITKSKMAERAKLLKEYGEKEKGWFGKLLDSWRDTNNVIEQSTESAVQNIQSGWANCITGVLLGDKSVNSMGEFWRAVLDQMVAAFANFIATIITKWTMSGIANLIGSIFGGGGGGFLESLAGSALGKWFSSLFGGTGTELIANTAKSGMTNVAGSVGTSALGAVGGKAIYNAVTAGATAVATNASLAALDATAAATASQWATASAMSASMGGGAAAAGSNAALAATMPLMSNPVAIATVIPALVAAGQVMDALLPSSFDIEDAKTAIAEAEQSMARMMALHEEAVATGDPYAVANLGLEQYFTTLEKSAAMLGWSTEQTDAFINSLHPATAALRTQMKVTQAMKDSVTGLDSALGPLAETINWTSEEAHALYVAFNAGLITADQYQRELAQLASGARSAGSGLSSITNGISGIDSVMDDAAMSTQGFTTALNDLGKVAQHVGDGMASLGTQTGQATNLVGQNTSLGSTGSVGGWSPGEMHTGGLAAISMFTTLSRMIPRLHGGTDKARFLRTPFEIPVIMDSREFVTRATSVTPSTLPVLDSINRTGRVPVMAMPQRDDRSAPAPVVNNFNAPLVVVEGDIDSDERVEELTRKIKAKLDERGTRTWRAN